MTPPSAAWMPDRADIEAAAAVLDVVAHRTPVLTSRTLDEAVGARVFLKSEHLQRGGAFKFRGAFHALSRLAPDTRAGGVVAYSSGNHAQAVALAARLLGVAATIVMPHDAPPTKRAATEGYGARVVGYDRYAEDRAAVAARVAAESGAHLVPPYDDPDVIAGQGTAALELLAEVGAIDVLLVPLGGGGLLAGSLAAATGAGLRTYGVEPASADDFARSLAVGERLVGPPPHTVADCLATPAPGVLTFPVVQALAAGVLTVTDAELVGAMRFCFERLHQVVEPGGAAGVAALLAGRVPDIREARVGVILSGGNVGAERFGALVGPTVDEASGP